MPFFKPNDDDSDHLDGQYGREVLFEVTFIGNIARVIAIDAETGVEVSMIGPPTATKYSLKMNAMRKLMRVLRKMEKEETGTDHRRPRRPGRYA